MGKKYNHALHQKLQDQGLRQKDLGTIVGLDPAKISMVLNGWLIPNEKVKVKIAKALGCRSEEIFRD